MDIEQHISGKPWCGSGTWYQNYDDAAEALKVAADRNFHDGQNTVLEAATEIQSKLDITQQNLDAAHTQIGFFIFLSLFLFLVIIRIWFLYRKAKKSLNALKNSSSQSL